MMHFQQDWNGAQQHSVPAHPSAAYNSHIELHQTYPAQTAQTFGQSYAQPNNMAPKHVRHIPHLPSKTLLSGQSANRPGSPSIQPYFSGNGNSEQHQAPSIAARYRPGYSRSDSATPVNSTNPRIRSASQPVYSAPTPASHSRSVSSSAVNQSELPCYTHESSSQQRPRSMIMASNPISQSTVAAATPRSPQLYSLDTDLSPYQRYASRDPSPSSPAVPSPQQAQHVWNRSQSGLIQSPPAIYGRQQRQVRPVSMIIPRDIQPSSYQRHSRNRSLDTDSPSAPSLSPSLTSLPPSDRSSSPLGSPFFSRSTSYSFPTSMGDYNRRKALQNMEQAAVAATTTNSSCSSSSSSCSPVNMPLTYPLTSRAARPMQQEPSMFEPRVALAASEGLSREADAMTAESIREGRSRLDGSNRFGSASAAVGRGAACIEVDRAKSKQIPTAAPVRNSSTNTPALSASALTPGIESNVFVARLKKAISFTSLENVEDSSLIMVPLTNRSNSFPLVANARDRSSGVRYTEKPQIDAVQAGGVKSTNSSNSSSSVSAMSKALKRLSFGGLRRSKDVSPTESSNNIHAEMVYETATSVSNGEHEENMDPVEVHSDGECQNEDAYGSEYLDGRIARTGFVPKSILKISTITPAENNLPELVRDSYHSRSSSSNSVSMSMLANEGGNLPCHRSSPSQSSSSTTGSPGVSFSPHIKVYDTWTAGEYDRKIADHAVTYSQHVIDEIKREMNAYKMEMEVHEESRCYTCFY
ncbi:uncharacterized protein V1516DRAFT_677000, partial [Lipomyces oligophaga]|uniref:uncharacterized protein n=1 Tax=Lipomyces oligophaga TaxID=45792 RepID=UPI0034CD5BF0